MRTIVLITLVTLAVSDLAAQGIDRLPEKLSGRWTVVNPGGQTIIDNVSIVFDGKGEAGPVTGRYTFRGRICGAQDEPFVGAWDGVVLRFETLHKANVNTQRMGGECGDGRVTYVLRRKPGDRSFDGEGKFESLGLLITISVSP